jgi:chemosensory pili system protein ChpA (sensor histidine kinase/response regulator)
VGQEIELKCTDNGAGLDAYAIHQKAIEYGLVSDNEPLTPEQIYRLILLPGFSTKAEVTEISGRGVGLDVVNDRVVAMKGRIGIASVPGEGTTFTLTLPQSLGAARIVVAEAGGQRFGLPVESVERALAADQFTVQHSSVQIEGETWPLIDMSAVLGVGARHESSRTSLVLCRVDDRRVGLLVEKVVDSREVILQDAGTLLRRIPGVAAATLREDGRALLILDVAGLAGVQPHRVPTSRMRSRAQTERTRVLVVDDALSARRAMAQLFEDAGFDAIACKDGQEAIERLRERTPSAVVTDLEMPMVNGVELTQRIRENPSWSALPVVMITSRGSDKHRERAHAAGVNVFLTKPFSDVELLSHIRTLLSKTSASTPSIEQ